MLLLKLPYLAHIEILEQLELYQLFFLGLCSKRTKFLVKKNCPKYDNAVIYMSTSCIQVQKRGIKGQDVVMWSAKNQPENMHLRDEDSFWEERVKLDFREKRIRCRISSHPDNGIPILWCKSKYRNLLPMAIHHYICDIFKLSSEIQVDGPIDDWTNFPDTDEIDNFIQWGACIEPEPYEKFFEKIRIRNCAYVQFYNSIDLKTDSRIFSIDHLFCISSNFATKDHLLNFKGRSLKLFAANKIRSDDLCAVIHNWLNGTNTILESIVIFQYKEIDIIFDRNVILKDFVTTPWNPEKRGKRFKYPPTIRIRDPKDLLDCSDAMDIERGSDGLLASILIDEHSFRFFIWHERFPNEATNQPVMTDIGLGKKPEFFTGDIFF